MDNGVTLEFTIETALKTLLGHYEAKKKPLSRAEQGLVLREEILRRMGERQRGG